MRLTAKAIIEKKKKGEKIVSLTAYDYPMAHILDELGVDIILVGDSLGMVLLGFDSTEDRQGGMLRRSLPWLCCQSVVSPVRQRCFPIFYA